MYRVLIAADGNATRVRKQAEAVADLPGAAENVVAVVLNVVDDTAAEVHDATRVQSVSKAVDYLRERGIETEPVGRTGDIVNEIRVVAEDEDVNAIYVGGPKRSPAGKALFGSTSQQIILNATRPVVVTTD